MQALSHLLGLNMHIGLLIHPAAVLYRTLLLLLHLSGPCECLPTNIV